jgi:hypothetical protein
MGGRLPVARAGASASAGASGAAAGAAPPPEAALALPDCQSDQDRDDQDYQERAERVDMPDVPEQPEDLVPDDQVNDPVADPAPAEGKEPAPPQRDEAAAAQYDLARQPDWESWCTGVQHVSNHATTPPGGLTGPEVRAARVRLWGYLSRGGTVSRVDAVMSAT